MYGSFAERLKIAMAGRNRRQVCAKSGVGYTTMDKYLSGNSLPGLKAIVGISDATGYSVNWLATGAGPRLVDKTPMHVAVGTDEEQTYGMQLVLPTHLSDADDLILLPMLGIQASAGSGLVTDDEGVHGLVAFTARWLRAHHITPSAAHVLTAKGDSMEPTIRNGDLLVVDRSITQAVDSAVYVVVYNGLLLVKRIFMLANGGLVLSSDNKAIYSRDEEIQSHDIDQLHIAGRVMWCGRGM